MYLFESRCAQSGITIVKELCRDLPAIEADQSQLQQVFTNLIINAMQAMPGEGRLKIETDFDENFVYLMRDRFRNGDDTGNPRNRYSYRSLRPRTSSREPGWGCRWFMALSKPMGAA